MKTELLVAVSDLHCGSVVGLAPPETKMESGNIVGFGKNLHQKWLWENWVSGIEKVKSIVGKSKAALLVNGDATEGVHHRNEADTIAAMIETHLDMAETCLRPFLKICKSSFVVAGTECHTKGMETRLAQRLGSVCGLAKDKWLFEINGCLVDAAHHMTTTSRAYLEASAMSILMGNARLNCLRSGHQIPKIFLRAHRHCGGFYSDGQGLYGVTGAWQFLTRHGFKVVTDSIPRPTILILDWRGKPEGSLPTPHEIVFNPPQNEIHRT